MEKLMHEITEHFQTMSQHLKRQHTQRGQHGSCILLLLLLLLLPPNLFGLIIIAPNNQPPRTMT